MLEKNVSTVYSFLYLYITRFCGRGLCDCFCFVLIIFTNFIVIYIFRLFPKGLLPSRANLRQQIDMFREAMFLIEKDNMTLCNCTVVHPLCNVRFFKIVQRNTSISVRFFLYEYRDAASVYTVLGIWGVYEYRDATSLYSYDHFCTHSFWALYRYDCEEASRMKKMKSRQRWMLAFVVISYYSEINCAKATTKKNKFQIQ